MSGPRRGESGTRTEAGATTGRRRTGDRLVALFAAGIAALNFPLVAALRGTGLVGGVPAPYVYLFLVWLLLAAGTALALRGSSGEDGDRSP